MGEHILQKFEKFVDRCGRLSLNTETNFGSLPYWRKSGCFSEDDIVIVSIILKGGSGGGVGGYVEGGTY